YKTITAYLVDSMKSTIQYLRDAVLGDYRNGSVVGTWVAGTYARGIKINYKKGIYISLVDGNTDEPTKTDTWYMQQQFFIGLDERLAYNGKNLVLTYALNRWFGTTFRQPGTGTSDIYITTNVINANTFVVGKLSAESSWVGFETSSEAITYNSTFGVQYNANINVPSSLYASLGTAADALLRSFINQYIYLGVTYQIVVY
ncbi:hypothetical protein, partial [Mucilaginibacter sp. 10I4]|uniref:hypothetical protein n=1 Tax=Mucilaginibacter sp. 10I4 TaxID=3048580 RepID=UPI002B229D9B